MGTGEDLTLRPVSGEFDLGAIRAYLDERLLDVVPDPAGTGWYLVGGTPSWNEYWVDKRRREPEPRGIGTAAFLVLDPGRIDAYQTWSHEDGKIAMREILRWLYARQPFTVQSNEYGGDLTPALLAGGIDGLYPEELRDRPRWWDGHLIVVGVWSEHPFSATTEPSIDDAARPGPDPALAGYLESGHLLGTLSGEFYDLLDDEQVDPTDTLEIRTDGVYAWPADLATYVRRDHVAVPGYFRRHVAALGPTVPAEIDRSRALAWPVWSAPIMLSFGFRTTT